MGDHGQPRHPFCYATILYHERIPISVVTFQVASFDFKQIGLGCTRMIHRLIILQ